MNGLMAKTEIDPELLASLPEALQKVLINAVGKNVHTVRMFTDLSRHNLQAKVGESGRVITLSVQEKGGKWLQGLRPSIQIRPAVIDALRPHMGVVGEWLGQYLEDARGAGLIDDSAPGDE